MARRYLRALVVAVFLALVVSSLAPRVMDVPIPSPCANLTPDDWFWWWFYGCEKDSSGGGGSGAG